MGSADLAAGQALRLIRFAQQQAKKGNGVTYQDFSERFSDLLMPEFARRDGDMVIVRGADVHFAWLKKKAEAGRKGGRSKTESKTKHLKQNRITNTEAPPKQIEASSSYSSSYSSSNSPSIISNSSNSTQKVHTFVAAYCDRFKTRWGHSPPILGKDAGIAKRLAKDLSLGRYEALLEAYFQMPDAWVVKNKHTLGIFESKLNEIAVFMETGKFTTAREVRDADNMATNMQLLNKIDKGEI